MFVGSHCVLEARLVSPASSLAAFAPLWGGSVLGGVIVMEAGFPGSGSVVVSVSCRNGALRAKRHPATFRSDWSLEVPHDVDLERIGVALGGVATCVELVDRVVPAVRDVWLQRQRLAPAGIAPTQTGGWRPVLRPDGCRCARVVFKTAELAADHVRETAHWARVHGVPERRVKDLLVSLEQASGVGSDPGRRAWPASSAVHARLDLGWLWEVGVHPDRVAAIHRELRLDEPLMAVTYLNIEGKGIEVPWLARFGGADVIAWAAANYGDHDVTAPQDRLAWVRAGVHRRLIRELLGGVYALDDVCTVAQENRITVNAAALLLAGWQQAGCEASVEQIVRMCRLVPHGRQTPAAAAVDAVVEAVGPLGSELPRVEVALVVVAAGTAGYAISLLRRGVRTLDDLEAHASGAAGGG